MKRLLFFLLMLNASLTYAQKDIPAYGSIDKSDLTMTECELDKEASSYKLLALGEVHYEIGGNEDFKIVTEMRVRIKVLKEKGKEEANVKLRYYSINRYEDIYNIAGQTYNLDDAGKITVSKLQKSSVYDKKINNRISEISFSLPDVKVGSVIEYKFKDVRKSISNIDDWYFQDKMPTRISTYQILVPEIFRFSHKVLTYQPVDYSAENRNESAFLDQQSINFISSRKTFTLRNIPGFTEEPYMGAPKDYLQRVEFQLTALVYGGMTHDLRSTWPKITKELMEDEDYGMQLKKNIPKTSQLDEALKNIQDDYAKMVIIHNYVRKNMNWNGIESLYSVDGIRSAWDKKSGNSSELNFIMIDLMRDAGLKAYPLLVSTKDNGTVNPLYPFIQQFNETMTMVLIGNKKYVLNAADKYNPATLVPYDVLGNEVLIVDKDAGGWVTLESSRSTSKTIATYFAAINDKGEMEGSASIYSYDYAKNPLVKEWTENRSSFKDRYTGSYASIKINNLKVSGEDNDSMPLKQQFDFSLPLNASGEYQYFRINLFQGLDKNPFIADKRITDIDFNFKQSYSLIGKVSLPEGYEFDELPKSIRLVMPDSSITLRRLIQGSPDAVDFRITLDFSKTWYPMGDYAIIQEFYKKLFNILNEQIVIRKKK